MSNKQSSYAEYALLTAWLIALIATLVSLYSSEVLKMPVCTLCWGQRIFIFPLAIQLGIATFRNDARIPIYTIPLAALGALIALYHYLIQMIPAMAPFTPCHADGSNIRCEQIDWQLFGFITFPLLSLTACLLIILLLIVVLNKKVALS